MIALGHHARQGALAHLPSAHHEDHPRVPQGSHHQLARVALEQTSAHCAKS